MPTINKWGPMQQKCFSTLKDIIIQAYRVGTKLFTWQRIHLTEDYLSRIYKELKESSIKLTNTPFEKLKQWDLELTASDVP